MTFEIENRVNAPTEERSNWSDPRLAGGTIPTSKCRSKSSKEREFDSISCTPIKWSHGSRDDAAVKPDPLCKGDNAAWSNTPYTTPQTSEILPQRA